MQYFVTNSRSAHVSAPTTPVPSLHRVPLVRTILRGPRIQSQLVIGAVNDPAEREADRAADQVMRMPEPGVSVASDGPGVRRMCAGCREEMAGEP